MFSFGITKYFSENIIIRNLVMSKCTAEPTLLCTFSVVSLFSNIIFWNHGDGSSDHLETNDSLDQWPLS